MSKLKVYGWEDFSRRWPSKHGQVRRCVAAHSMAEVARIVGVNRPSQLFNLTVTANKGEVALCIANPGVIYEKPLDSYNSPPVIMVKNV